MQAFESKQLNSLEACSWCCAQLQKRTCKAKHVLKQHITDAETTADFAAQMLRLSRESSG